MANDASPSPPQARRPADRRSPAGFILVILLAGTVYTLSTHRHARRCCRPNYLLQQLQIGAFLGIVAAGMMMVILLGHIDLSVPWTHDRRRHDGDHRRRRRSPSPSASPSASWSALFNGFGVAYLRIPSMIFTLGVNSVMRGLMVAHTGGFAPQTEATDLMRYARRRPHPRHPGRALRLGRRLDRRRRASCRARLRQAPSTPPATARPPPTSPASAPAGSSSAPSPSAASAPRSAGVLLAGYSTKAYQGMGNAYLLPAIAAVVHRRHQHPRRPRPLHRHAGRRHPDRAAQLACCRSCRCPRPAGRSSTAPSSSSCCWSTAAPRRSRVDCHAPLRHAHRCRRGEGLPNDPCALVHELQLPHR